MPLYPKTPKENFSHAKAMRRLPTKAEQRLWSRLRKRPFGVYFRRQSPIGRFIADFVCKELKLIIEIDGDVHTIEGALEYDQEREKYLRELGFKIKRYTNNDVLQNIDSVLQDIYLEISPEPPL